MRRVLTSHPLASTTLRHQSEDDPNVMGIKNTVSLVLIALGVAYIFWTAAHDA
jgi:hypothetical protein